MLEKIIRNSNKKERNFTIQRLKKKWRFWRTFKFYFLRSKKKKNFIKLAWLSNQKRIVWHQLSSMYGKNIKNMAYTNHKSKYIFNTNFGNILTKLELRLNIILVRLHFVEKLLQANYLIHKKIIKVNGISKNKKYILSAGDFLTYEVQDQNREKISREQFKKKQESSWRKFRNENFKRIFFLLRKMFIFNFIEVSYSFFSAILLRNPLFGEIIYRNKKQLLISSLLQKIYFLY